MSKNANILISSIGLPASRIGSWTTRMTNLISKNPDFFNYILSPNESLAASRYCKKRSFITWKKPLRKLQLLHWVGKDYIRQLKTLSKAYDKLTIVVMDDPHLLEAISLIKHKIKCEIELVFSFHGFDLNIDSRTLKATDKILWLSQLGLEKSKAKYNDFPKSYVVGNAINSKTFFPLEYSDYEKERMEKGYTASDEILVWMANDRPKKGFHIFKEVVEELFKSNENLKVIIIGSSQTINHSDVVSIGKIPNHEVASYLQISNYYMFTTLYEEGFGLSVVEAAKCGNTVIASNRGAIPEVLKDIKHSYLVDHSEAINSWIESFNLARTNSNFGKTRLSKQDTDKIWNYKDWEQKFINTII